MNFDEIDEFTKELKKLSKKYPSLRQDLRAFEMVLSASPLGIGKHFAVLSEHEHVAVVKARLFCRYLKNSTLRIVYAHNKTTDTITFIELYFKGDKETESTERIHSYLAAYAS